MSDNYVYQRSLLAYVYASEIVSGTVLEIGTGSGYGIKVISPKVNKFITIDKYKSKQVDDLPDNVLSIKMEVPVIYGIPDNSVDYVISFQVIEHIEKDTVLIKEINRVLKKGGKLILSTPNRKMSLTRNPWHVREYTIDELEVLLADKFEKISKFGVFGNEKIMDYYNENRKSVQSMQRIDFFNLWKVLPRQLLQIPYDILNRLNRRKLLKSHFSLCSY